MKHIIKDAIIDGYLKIWDIGGTIPIGSKKYDGKIGLSDLEEYFKWLNVSMITSFSLLILSILFAVFSVTFHWYSEIISITPYLIFVSPMAFYILTLIKDRIYEFKS